jgi:N12 class adenine-specific DNA methylase
VGWGAFGQPFHVEYDHLDHFGSWEAIPEWSRSRLTDTDREHLKLRFQIKAAIPPEDYASARASITNAHYTSPPVVKAMWEACRHLGFTGGRVLEPAVGTGNFLGFQPEDLTVTSRRTGVELDTLTAKIAKHLYPAADVRQAGFQATPLPDNCFDLAISNVPFANVPVHDPEFKKTGRGWINKQGLHNWYFAKALDKVRPGGVVAFITSHHTLDASSRKEFRDYLASQAHFLGAVRLPRTAFQGNAGTKVTTDIIFLQKKDPVFESQHPRDAQGRFIEKWTGVTGVRMPSKAGYEREMPLNEYFAEHPEMMLGRMGWGSGYGQVSRDETGMEEDGRDLHGALQEALRRLPAGVMHPPTNQAEIQAEEAAKRAPSTVKPGAFVVEDGKIYVNESGKLVEVQREGKDRERVLAMVKVRDAALHMVALESGDASDEELAAGRKALNEAYDACVKEHGALHLAVNNRAFLPDPDGALIRALEEWDPNTKTGRKGPMFERRTITPVTRPTSASTPEDALGITLNECGRLNWARMSELLGWEPDEIQQELHGQGLAYQDPAQMGDTITGGWVLAEEYLSGNVRQKLRVAQAYAANHPEYAANVAALEAIQPTDLLPSEIDARLGAPWIPPDVVDDFLNHLLVPDQNYRDQESTFNRDTQEWDPGYRRASWVRFDPRLGKWAVETRDYRFNQTANTATWGMEERTAAELLEGALNLKDPVVYGEDGDGKRYVDKTKTAAAYGKQQSIKEEFEKWVWGDDKRALALAALYNEHFNDSVPRRFDGSHLTLPGLAAEVAAEGVRKHIKDAVWRILQTGTALIDHCVGAGKTRLLCMAAMEQRRLGLAKKPLLVVPNHMIEQWDRDFRAFYPGAKVLTVRSDDWTNFGRKELSNRIATGDWDAVIITHSAFTLMPSSPKLYEDFYHEQIDELNSILAEMQQEGGNGNDRTQKEIEKQVERLRVKLQDKTDRLKARQDDTVPFDHLGVDSVLVDESHAFKNLFFPTKMNNVVGLQRAESDRSMDMFVKTQHLMRKNGGRGLVFATATPISNSLAEMYTMLRYLALPLLKEKNLHHFDNWCGTFAEVKQTVEAAPEGGYRSRNRLGTFVNMPENVKLYRTVADVRTIEDLPEVQGAVPELHGGTPTRNVADGSDELRNFTLSLQARAKAIKEAGWKQDKKEDNFLKIMSEARKASLDMRLLPQFADLPDDPNSKVNLCVENVAQLYHDSTDRRGTQLIFLDLGTPKGAADKPKKDEDESQAAGAETETESRERDSVYGDIRRKLVAQGLKPEEIAFIHEWESKTKRPLLQQKMNSGQIRVLIGSTGKMGTGMNVQERLYALHHLDAPWKPADLEQREGRIIRQGNRHADTKDGWNIPVQIHRYSTKGSSDEFMWQQLLSKSKFITQAKKGELQARRMENIDGAIEQAAAMMHDTSEEPRWMEAIELEGRIAHLGAMRSNWQSTSWKQKQTLANLPLRIDRCQNQAAAFDAAARVWAANRPEKFTLQVGKKSYDSREEAGKALRAAWGENLWDIYNGREPELGEYAGFRIYGKTNADKQVVLLVKDPKSGVEGFIHDIGTEAGITTKIDNHLKQLGELANTERAKKAQYERQAEDLKREVAKPFEHEEEFRQIQVRHKALLEVLEAESKAREQGAGAAAPEGPAPVEGVRVAVADTARG